MKVYTQLSFGGNCEEAFHFYEANLGGKVLMMMRQNQAPMGQGTRRRRLFTRG